MEYKGEIRMSVEVIAAKGSLEGALGQVAQRIFKVCSSKGANEPLVVGLCGGRSVVGLLSALEQESVNQPRELLKRIQFFMVDERLVPLTDEQSNFGGLKRLLFDTLIEKGVVDERQLHPFITKRESTDFGCGAYLQELQSLGGKFTVVVLGVGEDGHVAGLFPHHATLQEKSGSFLHFHDSPKPPQDRMTASVPLITGSELSVVLALGEGKREAWNAFNNDEVVVAACPAKLAAKAHSCLVVTDLA
jgi:6-phosphogluconolactonase